MLRHSLLLAVNNALALAATPAQWRGRSIYQVLTDRFARTDGSTTISCNLNDYCGGSWQGIIDKLDYIQDMGFTAIWISPITQQVQGLTSDGNSYHGYWQNDIYALNTKFGSASDLKDLSAALHAREMYLMVDVVVNHFAWEGNYNSVQYNTYVPFNDSRFFHPYCPIDYNNVTSTKICWMGDSTVELPDVNTTLSDVRSIYTAWISNLVSTYSIDGLRIDTCLEVETGFFPGFISAAGTYAVCEVDNGDPTTVEPYQQVSPGVLNYPLYYPLIQAFGSTSGSISNLVNMVNTIKSGFVDSTLLGTFSENHDNPRFPSYTSDIALASNVIAFGMLADGVPIIYEGQEQHYSGGSVPNNREDMWQSDYSTTASPLYRLIASVNQLRNHAVAFDSGYVTYRAWPIYSDTTTIAMRKGSDGTAIIGVFSNKGATGTSYAQTIGNTGYAANIAVVEILSCTDYLTTSSGAIDVNMTAGAPRLFYPSLSLKGSGICGT